MNKKKCSVCGKEYPEDKKHFRWRVQNGKGAFTKECLICRKKANQRSNARAKEKRERELNKIEAAGVNEFVKLVGKGGSNIPHSAEVIEQVMSYFGGVAGFSAVLVKQYWDAPPGGSARNRLLETMTRLVSKNVEQGGARKPLTLWSEEELEKELDDRLKQVVVLQGNFTDGKETQPKIASQEITEQTSITETSDDKVSSRRDKGTPRRDTGS